MTPDGRYLAIWKVIDSCDWILHLQEKMVYIIIMLRDSTQHLPLWEKRRLIIKPFTIYTKANWGARNHGSGWINNIVIKTITK
jgi:hypothetical protein